MDMPLCAPRSPAWTKQLENCRQLLRWSDARSRRMHCHICGPTLVVVARARLRDRSASTSCVTLYVCPHTGNARAVPSIRLFRPRVHCRTRSRRRTKKCQRRALPAARASWQRQPPRNAGAAGCAATLPCRWGFSCSVSRPLSPSNSLSLSLRLLGSVCLPLHAYSWSHATARAAARTRRQLPRAAARIGRQLPRSRTDRATCYCGSRCPRR